MKEQIEIPESYFMVPQGALLTTTTQIFKDKFHIFSVTEAQRAGS